VTFTPTTVGGQPGTLTVTSSDPGSPAMIPLSGTGVGAGSFTLTVGGGNTGSATVSSGTSANYGLTITPLNGFTGTVVLNCTPITPALYATCSILPSSVTLASGVQGSTVTISTVTSIAANERGPNRRRDLGDTALALLFPTLIFTWKSRTSRHRAWRQVGPAVWLVFVAATLLMASGCGGGGGANPNTTGPTNLRYTPAGSYQYEVTASGTSGGSQITESVTLNLTVQ
jgi:hypothetical protein